jgi:predicted RND superfamily exporter protein
MGIGIDDGIHMMKRFDEVDGQTRQVLDTTGRSVWRTSATTILAFGSLGFSESPALASLGQLLTVGVLVCFLTSTLVLPALADRDA